MAPFCLLTSSYCDALVVFLAWSSFRVFGSIVFPSAQAP